MSEHTELTLRDQLALGASEEDIKTWSRTRVEDDTHGLVYRFVRTREEARYAFADAMLKARSRND